VASLAIALLGRFHVERDGQPITAFESVKVRALLAYLVVEADREHQRSALAGLLWPDHPEHLARTNLRHVLRQLRQSLSDQNAPTPLLLTTQDTIQINPASHYSLDVTRFGDLLAAAEACDHTALAQCTACIERYSQAAALYRGPFLAGLDVHDSILFDEWAIMRREQLHRAALETFFTLATLYERRGEYEKARYFAWRQLELEPWREEAHRQVMRVLALDGQRAAALAQYEVCRQVLAKELGVEPEAETTALYHRLRAEGGKAKELAGAPPATDHSPMTNMTVGGRGRDSHQDWGEAPTTAYFYGRHTEQALLKQWVKDEGCRVVLVMSMGGMGKTSLVIRTAKALADEFDFVFWRSLVNAPPLADVVRECLQFVSCQQGLLPATFAEQVTLLFDYLRQYRCLLVLDNVETILEAGAAGHYRAGYAGYGQLIERMALSQHRSCLMLTSRERPLGVGRLAEDSPLVRMLPLTGLEQSAGEALLKTRGVADRTELVSSVVQRYSGNPLALKLVARTIEELFDGDIAAFLSDDAPIFDDIRTVLDQQFARLTPLERDILIWLAIEREAVALPTLAQAIVTPPPRRDLLEALRALQRRALIEKTAAGFTLQNVVMEYITDYIVEQAYREVERGALALLNRYALVKAQAKQYVRQSQLRLILQPLARRLFAHFGHTLETTLKQRLDAWRDAAPLLPGYAGGNLLTLLLHLGFKLRGLDFSRLSVWQADLREVELAEVSFREADLTGCTFSGTFGLIYAVAYSPDGQLLAVGTGDGKVHLWRVTDYQPYAVYQGHDNIVQCVAFSPDSRSLVSGSLDKTVCVWDTQTGQHHTLVGHTDWVWSVAFSPDGKTVASGSYDRTVRLWNTQTGQPLHILKGHTDWVRCVAFSPVRPILASSSADRTIRLWNIEDGHAQAVLSGHTSDVFSLAFSADGETVVSGGADRTVRVWDVATGETRYTLTGHQGEVQAVAIASDNHTLASGGGDQTVRLWDVRSGQALYSLLGHTNWIRSLAFSPDGKVLASGSADQTVRVWDTHTGQALQTLQGHLNAIWSVAFNLHPDLDRAALASGSDDQKVRLWDVHSGRVIHTLHGHIGDVRSVAFSPDGYSLASGGVDHTIRVWEVTTGHARRRLDQHTNAVLCVTYSPDGTTLASGSADQTVRLWDTATWRVLHTLTGHTSVVRTIAFSPDGTRLASGSEDHSIRVWEVATGQLRHILQGHAHWLRSVAFSPDGQWLASSSADQTIRLWDMNSGQPHMILQGHTDIVVSLAFSPDGLSLASGSSDRTVRLWEVATGQVRRVLTGHSLWVRSVAFSPDGQTLASGSADETIRLWDVHSGACLEILRADGPYAGLDITGARGITEAQRAALKMLGAVEETLTYAHGLLTLA
jgi:WD40 repeat protein/DNA-binding SARP family transcriptional activator